VSNSNGGKPTLTVVAGTGMPSGENSAPVEPKKRRGRRPGRFGPYRVDKPTSADYERQLSAFRDLEHQICNIERMVGITKGLVSGWLEKSGRSLPREGELTVCAFEQLERMAAEIKREYYRAYETR